jgi:hypothetical protein
MDAARPARLDLRQPGARRDAAAAIDEDQMAAGRGC